MQEENCAQINNINPKSKDKKHWELQKTKSEHTMNIHEDN